MDMDSVKKALPKIAIAVGAALIVIVLVRWAMTPATVKGAIVIPSYDYYQDSYASVPFGQQQMTTNTVSATAMADVCGNGEKRGCKQADAANYDPSAPCACIGCCAKTVFGCLDKTNTNYNPWANTHDARFCATTTACTPGPLTGVLGPEGDLPGIPQTFFVTSISGAQVGSVVAPSQNGSLLQTQPAPVGFENGCVANFDTPLQGGIVSCGNPWSLSNGQYALGPTTY